MGIFSRTALLSYNGWFVSSQVKKLHFNPSDNGRCSWQMQRLEFAALFANMYYETCSKCKNNTANFWHQQTPQMPLEIWISLILIEVWLDGRQRDFSHVTSGDFNEMSAILSWLFVTVRDRALIWINPVLIHGLNLKTLATHRSLNWV